VGHDRRQADVDERVDFIRKTYTHLLCAILAFAGLEVFLFSVHAPERMIGAMQGGGRLMVFLFIAGFAW